MPHRLASKPLAAIDRHDVEAFLAEAPPENLFLELKQDLPEREGGRSKWVQEQKVSENSRNDLAAEIIAFANGDGGILVVGITETDEEPKRPAAILPLPAPALLARRLHDAIVDVIEPPLTAFEAGGVVTDENGGGIVVLRVEPSLLAPHRLNTGNYQSYVRRDDKKRKMSMREVHDMVLQRDRAATRFQSIFAVEEERFRAGLLLDDRDGMKHVRWQIMVAPRRIVNVQVKDRLLVPDANLRLFAPSGNVRSFDSDFSRGYDRWRPILGGLVNSGDIYFNDPGSYGRRVKEQRFRDGRYCISLEVTSPKNPLELPSEWTTTFLLRALNWIVLVRRASGEPMVDFGLQFITDNRHGFSLLRLASSDAFYRAGLVTPPVPQELVASPLYEIGTDDVMLRAANDIFGDIANSFGSETFEWTLQRDSYGAD